MQILIKFLSAFLLLILIGCGGPEEALLAAGPKTINGVTTASVRLENLPKTFESTGSVRARLNATLSSKVMSRVVAVNVREGDLVRTGQLLVALDSRELHSAVQMAGANLNAARVGVGNATTVAEMERKTSQARIHQAGEAVAGAKAAYNAAQSRLDLALAGPRTQEKNQARLAVQLAESNMKLSQTELERVRRLVEAGALAGRLLDSAENAADVAKAQYESALEAEKISQEGTRSEEIRTAKEAVSQAQAGVRQAEANLRQAKAAALQADVRKQEIRSAKAQTMQASAALGSAQVGLSYATVAAPFDGRVVSRLADPGSMAAPGVPLVMVEGGGLRLEAIVPESVLKHVSKGSVVPVFLDSLGTRPIQAQVVEIVPQGDASTHSFVVKLSLPSLPNLKSGMFGRARFVVGNHSRMMIPAEAVWEREGLNYIYVVNAQSIARLRIVTLGERTGDRIEVLSGLREGDEVVTLGRDRVVDGAKVQP